MRVNLITAVAALVDFENFNELAYAMAANLRGMKEDLYLEDEEDQPYLDENIIRPVLESMDYEVFRSLVLKPRLPDFRSFNSVSSYAYRVLTKLQLFWLQLSDFQRPRLVSFLTNLGVDGSAYSSNNNVGGQVGR